MSLRIGIDVGGVLSQHRAKNTDGSEHQGTSIDMPRCKEFLSKLKQIGHDLYIISFCGKSRAIETIQEIKKITHINADGKEQPIFDDDSKLCFVKKKEYKGKACKHFGIDVLIDDTLSLFEYVQKDSTMTSFIWFQGDPLFEELLITNEEKKDGKNEEISQNNNVLIAKDWDQAYSTIVTIKETRKNKPNQFNDKEFNKICYTNLMK